jgi:hypothetical protein
VSAKLPTEFADLEPFSDWCLDSEPQRYRKRLNSSMTQMQAFYDAITPRAEEAMAPATARRTVHVDGNMIALTSEH